MSKMVIIGAGSSMFAKAILGDLLLKDKVKVDEIALVDLDEYRLGVMKTLFERMSKERGRDIKVVASTKRREVLPGADYVVNTIGIGGPKAARSDVEIPDKYGVNQNLGDSLGPGGIFRGLRVLPEIIAMCKDIEELCPNAYFFQHSNPMAAIMIGIDMTTKVKAFGICHSIQGTVEHLSTYLGVEIKDLKYWTAGINHMGWFLRVEVDGKDQYPKLFEVANDRERIIELSKFEKGYKEMGANLVDFVRFDAMKRFRYFVSESPFHFGEYVPYYRKNEQMIKDLRVEDRWWLRHEDNAPKYFQELLDTMDKPERIEFEKSHHYVPDLIEAIETGVPFYCNMNVPNTGLITNLPPKACVEVPCYADAMGIHPMYVGDLPEQLAGLNRTNINVQMLIAAAAVEKKKDYIYDAARLDPMSSTLLTLDQIDAMVSEMIEANARYLVDYK
jgi:alpha-galactosidase